jgi:hypothetical protein
VVARCFSNHTISSSGRFTRTRLARDSRTRSSTIAKEVTQQLHDLDPARPSPDEESGLVASAVPVLVAERAAAIAG